MLDKARASGMFFFVDTDLEARQAAETVEVDRDMAGDARDSRQQDVGAALTSALGGGYVNYFSIAGRSYKVIPQVLQVDRLNPSQVLDYYLRAPDGSLLPASTVATQKTADGARGHQSLPAAQFGDDHGRVLPVGFAEAGARLHEADGGRGRAERLRDRLRRAVAAVRPGVGRLRPDAAVRRHHRLPRCSRRSTKASATRS